MLMEPMLKRKALITKSLVGDAIEEELICEKCGFPQITEEESGQLEAEYSSRQPVYVDICNCKLKVKFHVEFDIEGSMLCDSIELNPAELEAHILAEMDMQCGANVYMGNVGNSKVTNIKVKELQ